MNTQEIFNTVTRHLLTQNEKSRGGPDRRWACLYRDSTTGLKCAIGCLIKDEFYSAGLEGLSVGSSSAVRFALERSGIKLYSIDLLRDLQQVHDAKPVSHWRTSLLIVAQNYGLTFPEGV